MYEIGHNEYGWWVCEDNWAEISSQDLIQGRRDVKYLHPDGQWRTSMQMNVGCPPTQRCKLGYFDSKVNAQIALDLARGKSPILKEEESIWDGV